MKHLVAAAAALLVMLGAAAPAPVAARRCPPAEPRTDAEITSPGAPLPTAVAEWSGGGREVSLTVTGAGAFPQGARVVGTWVTPVTERAREHGFEIDMSLNGVTLSSKAMRVSDSVRVRLDGGCWMAWSRMRLSAPGPLMAGGGGAGSRASFYEPHTFQVEWRFEVPIKERAVERVEVAARVY